MRTSVDNADRQFLVRLNRLGSCTVQDLCDDLSVTATAVRQRLARLMSTGSVERETVHADRGRPYHVYRASTAGRRQLGDDYDQLAPLLWRELRQLQDRDLRSRLMSRLRDALVKRYGSASAGAPLAERFQHLQQELHRQGFQVDLDEREHGDELLPVLRGHSCPYHELASEDSSICDLEQSVFEEVLGVPVTLTQCCRDGHSCCEFEPVLT